MIGPGSWHQLPISDTGTAQASGAGESVMLQPVQVTAASSVPVPPQVPLGANFGDALVLGGYDLVSVSPQSAGLFATGSFLF